MSQPLVQKMPVKTRSDDFIDKGTICDNPIVKKFIHKEIVVKTGEGEDDWIIEQKPVLVEEYDIQKRINEEAKGQDLKLIVQRVIATGDATLLNQRDPQYADLTHYPESVIEANNSIIQLKDKLAEIDPDFKNKDIVELLNNYIADLIKSDSNYKEAAAKEKAAVSAGDEGGTTNE